MKMKKILNEWNKFLLNEAKKTKRFKTLQDKGLKAPPGWFNVWNHRMGLIDLSDWPDHIKNTYPTLKQDLEQNYTGEPELKDDFVTNVFNSINAGYGYYVKEYLSDAEYKNLVNKKLDEYFKAPENLVPLEDKKFFRDYVDWIFHYGIETAVPNKDVKWNEYIKPGYTGKVAFFGRSIDWYMFGQGIEDTWKTAREYMDSNKKAISDEALSSKKEQ